jgi:DNA-directed RNA polymerase sigma subunit (sigma70/sigma32)
MIHEVEWIDNSRVRFKKVPVAKNDMLDDREKEIIDLYFGINKRGENQTRPLCLEEIAHKFGLTRERIRQLKERALKKMLAK